MLSLMAVIYLLLIEEENLDISAVGDEISFAGWEWQRFTLYGL